MIKKPIPYLDSAVQKVSETLRKTDYQIYEKRIRAYAHLPGADKKLKMISGAQRDSVKDLLREVDIALIFKGLGFDLEVEPDRSTPVGKNIDLKLSKGKHTCFLEATRFRRMYDGPPTVELGAEVDLLLPEYGDPQRDVEKACQKIIRKFSQLGSEPTIIAIWNDDEDMEYLEVQMAVRKIIQEEVVPSSLMFILFISDVIVRCRQQMFCYPSRNSIEPYVKEWINGLQGGIVQDLIDDACRVLM
jgi:hypothetical protein